MTDMKYIALVILGLVGCGGNAADPTPPPPPADAGPFALGTLWTLASGQNSVTGIVVDDASVYWTTRFGGQVAKCAVDGCNESPTVLFGSTMTSPSEPVSIALDATSVYWAEGGGVVRKTPIAGGPITSFGLGGSAIAVDASNVYGAGGSITSCPIDGCTTGSTFLGMADEATHIAVDATSIYYADYEGVWKCPLSGCAGKPTALIDSMWDHAAGFAIDATNVYVSYSTKNFVLSCSKDGCGGSPTIFASPATDPGGGLTSDGVNVYWTNSIGVMRCPVTGCNGSPTTLVSMPSGAGGVTVDATSVYFWTNPDPSAPLQQIMKLTPK